MHQFFFDVDDGEEHILDEVGQVLPDRGAACAAAQEALPDMARDKLPDGNSRIFRVTVCDHDHVPFYAVTMQMTAEHLA